VVITGLQDVASGAAQGVAAIAASPVITDTAGADAIVNCFRTVITPNLLCYYH
jgi:hypothetical protein